MILTCNYIVWVITRFRVLFAKNLQSSVCTFSKLGIILIMSIRSHRSESMLCFVDIDECSDGSAQCDPKSTTCNNLIPDYECKCKPGYIVISNDKYKCKGNCLFMVSLTHCQQCI